MINGIGVLGWGVGGIEAEASLLGQPITISLPEVVGVRLHGQMKPGVTATDLVLTVTELLRKKKVVGKFIEFFGPAIKYLSVPERATISNMCPEYGATLALFPIDDQTLDYLRITGRDEKHIEMVKKYLELQNLFGDDQDIEYSDVIDFDLSTVNISASGPKLPQQRTDIGHIEDSFINFMENQSGNQQVTLKSVPVTVNGTKTTLNDGDIVIAALTSCTNTSNPYVMIASGLVAKKAYDLGLKVIRISMRQ